MSLNTYKKFKQVLGGLSKNINGKSQNSTTSINRLGDTVAGL
jgi:hypothetical protein